MNDYLQRVLMIIKEEAKSWEGKLKLFTWFLVIILIPLSVLFIKTYYLKRGWLAGLLVATFVATIFPGILYALKNKWTKRYLFVLLALVPLLLWASAWEVFNYTKEAYKPNEAFVFGPRPFKQLTVLSGHVFQNNFKKADILKIWSRSDFEVVLCPSQKAAYFDSLQKIDIFNKYIKLLNAPVKFNKPAPLKNKVAGKAGRTKFPANTTTIIPNKSKEYYIFKFLADVDSVRIESNPDSLLAYSVKHEIETWPESDLRKLQGYLILALIGLPFIALVLGYRAIMAKRDGVAEGGGDRDNFEIGDFNSFLRKLKSRQGPLKRAVEETPAEGVEVDSLGNDTYLGKKIIPRGTTAMRVDDKRGEVIRKVDQSIIYLTASIMDIAEDLINIQKEQSFRLAGAGGIISAKINGYVDRMLQEIKQRKIKDISMANEVLAELTKYRDLLRSFLTSDLKDRVATLRLQQEVVDLESKLFSARPKENDVEGNKKVRIKLRFSPLIKKYNSEIEAEQMMLFCETAEEYENDIVGMLKLAGYSGEQKKEPAKSEFEEKLEFYKRETTLQIQAMESLIERKMAFERMCDKVLKDRPEDGPQIIEELRRNVYEMGLI